MANETLYDVLIGVDEEGTASLVNQQLVELGKTLKDLQVKINIDDSFKKEIGNLLDQLKFEDLEIGGYSGANKDILKGHKKAIEEVMKEYGQFGATITNVFADADGNFKGLSLTARNAAGDIEKINFGEDFKKTSSKIFLNLDKQVNDFKNTINATEKDLARVLEKKAAGKSTPLIDKQEIELTKQLDMQYLELLNTINKSEVIDERRREELRGELLLLKEKNELARQSAQEKGKDAEGYEKAKKALKDYKAELALLTKIQLGQNDSKTEAESKKRLAGLKGVAKGYQEITKEMEQARVAEKENFKIAQVKQWEAQYDAAIKTIQTNVAKLQTAYEKLNYAQQHGDTSGQAVQQSKIDKLGKEIQEAEASALELGESLKKLGSTENILSGFAEELDRAKSVMMDTDRQAEELENRFGKLKTETASGVGMDELVKAYKEGSMTAEEFAKNIFGVSATVKDSGKDNSHYAQMTDTLKVAVKDANGEVRIFKATFDETAQGMRVAGGALDSVKTSVTGFRNQIMDAAKKIATWGVSTKIVYGTWRAFQDGIEVVKELDKELTQIAIVQGTTRASAKELGEQYAQTAYDLAKTVSEVAKLNTELIRQGLSLEESAERAETIMKLSSAGMVSMEQSLQVITTGVNALGETHEKVADVILKASMLSASDVEGLGEAFSKTASGAKAAGLSIEETSALLATMKEVTQEGDSQLGTSLKSMLARFNKINEETGEMNEDLNQVQTAIESVGVQFTDASGQIRSFYDITQDLSLVWEDLDKNTQAYIATQAAGVRQQNRFFAVMDNFNKVQAINNDLTNSAGTLQQSYATYMQSSEAASQRLRAAMEQLWINFIDSDVLIGLTDLATSLVKVADNVGVLNLAVMVLITKLGFLNKATLTLFKEGFLTSLQTAAKQMAALSGATTGAAASGKVFTAMLTGQIGIIKGTTVALAALKAGFLAIAPAAIGVAAAAGLFAFLSKAITESKNKAKEAREELNRIEETAKGHISNEAVKTLEIKENFEKIVEYRKNFSSLNSTELKDFYDLNNSLIETLPNLATQFDTYGNKIVDLSLDIDQVNQAYQDLRKEDFGEYLKNVDKVLSERREVLLDTDEATSNIHALKEQIEDIARIEDNQFLMSTQGARLATLKEELPALLEAARSQYQLLGNEAMSAMLTTMRARGEEIPQMLQGMLMDPEILQSIGQLYAEGTTGVDELLNSPKIVALKQQFESLKINVDGVTYSLGEMSNGFDRLRTRYENGAITLEEYKSKVLAVSETSEALAASYPEIAEGIRLQTSLEQDHISVLEAQILTEAELHKLKLENLESARSAYEAAGQAALDYQADLDFLNDTETTSVQIQDMILSNYPQWAYMMNDKAALSQAFQDAMVAEDQVRTESYINMLLNTASFTEATGGAYADLMSALGGYYTQDITNYSELESVKGKITETLIGELNDAWGDYFHSVDGYIEVNRQAVEDSIRMHSITAGLTDSELGMIIDSQVYALNQKAAAARNTIANITTAIDTFKASIDIPDFKNFAKDLSNIGSAGKKAGSGARDAADGAKEAADAIKEYNEAMKATQDATKEVFDFAMEYIRWIEEQKREAMEETFEAATKAAEDYYDDQIEDIEDQLEAELKVLELKQKQAKAEDELLEYLRKRKELQDGIIDLEYQLAIASLDSSVGGIKKRRELEQSLEEERKKLIETEEERDRRIQEEMYAREQAFMESQAEYQKMLEEQLRDDKILKAQEVYDAEKAYLDQKYSDENVYLLARQATQEGMIENLHGNMIPLVEAFEELAKANGEFWTFFGQQEVEEFGTKVKSVLEAIKQLGFDTIQTWKEVASAAEKATNAANAASSASRSTSSPSPSPKPTPTPTPTTTRPDASASVIREFQRLLNLVPNSGSSIKVDGSFGGLTTAKADRASAQLRKTTQGKAIANSVDNATVKTLTTSLNQALANVVKATAVSSTGRTVSAYADGGKVDYTGPAMVHGSKSKPEYVFNYQQFKDLAKMIARHELTKPIIKNPITTQPISVTIDKLIEVQGSVDKNALPELQRMTDDAVNKLANKLKGWGK